MAPQPSTRGNEAHLQHRNQAPHQLVRGAVDEEHLHGQVDVPGRLCHQKPEQQAQGIRTSPTSSHTQSTLAPEGKYTACTHGSNTLVPWNETSEQARCQMPASKRHTSRHHLLVEVVVCTQP